MNTRSPTPGTRSPGWTGRTGLAARIAVAAALAASLSVSAQEIKRSASPLDARIYIISPKDGEAVSNPVTVLFGLSGMGVAPAGVAHPGAGHHHLIVDADLPDPALPIPSDDQHRHFGRGQTETTIELSPGEHTLQLLLGDQDHVPHDPPLHSEQIRIRVE